MTARIDLHTHSDVSDGTATPAEVVEGAARAALDVVALTDHDSLAGIAAATEAAERLGVELVPGVEMSCRAEGISLHLLAYWPDPGDEALAAEMALARDDRVPRMREMARRLAADGYPVTYEEVVEAAGPAVTTLGRPHLAHVLVAHGVVGSVDEAFARLLHHGSAYYAPHHGTDPVQAVRLVRAAGGVTVFAHPYASHRGAVVADEVVAAMAAAGLAGLEVDHPEQTPPQRARAAAMADRLGLLATGASDFHGSRKAQGLGACLTRPDVFLALRARADATRRG